MGIDDYFIILVLVLGFIFSGLQKLVEKLKANRRAQEERSGRAREIVNDTVRTAQRREIPRQPEPARSEAPSVEEVIRRLMGEELVQPVSEHDGENTETEDWQPVTPPPLRRAPPERTPAAPPRQMYEPPRPRPAQPLQRAPQPQPHPHSARPVRQRPARTPSEMISQPRRRVAEDLTPEELEQRESERRWREEMERRKKLQAAQQAQQAKQRKDLPRPRTHIMPSRRRLLGNRREVRRAIILSEILGSPRAFHDLEERA